MKIKNGLQGVVKVSGSSGARVSGDSSEASSATEESDGVSLSEQTSFIQVLKEAARGQEPIRSELIEQAKVDLANGVLGSKEDYEQAINAILREL